MKKENNDFIVGVKSGYRPGFSTLGLMFCGSVFGFVVIVAIAGTCGINLHNISSQQLGYVTAVILVIVAGSPLCIWLRNKYKARVITPITSSAIKRSSRYIMDALEDYKKSYGQETNYEKTLIVKLRSATSGKVRNLGLYVPPSRGWDLIETQDIENAWRKFLIDKKDTSYTQYLNLECQVASFGLSTKIRKL